jgi:hypothetical protein
MAALTTAQQTAIDTKRVTLLDLERKLELIEAGKIMAGGLLLQIREEQLWSVDPDRAYASFEQYTEERWGFGKREADRKIEAFQQVKALQDAGVTEADLPTNPWQARDLTVLANKTDGATAARTWVKALTDSKDPQINPGGRFTGVFLKGYVDQALATAGAARRQGTSRARQGTATAAARNGTVHRTAPSTPSAPSAPSIPPAPANIPSSNGLGIVPPTNISAEVLYELADDVRTRRLHLGNPIARTPLLAGLRELLEQVAAQITPTAARSAEADALHYTCIHLAAAIVDTRKVAP